MVYKFYDKYDILTILQGSKTLTILIELLCLCDILTISQGSKTEFYDISNDCECDTLTILQGSKTSNNKLSKILYKKTTP